MIRKRNEKTEETVHLTEGAAEAALPFDNRIWLSVCFGFGKGCRVAFRPEAVWHIDSLTIEYRFTISLCSRMRV